MNLYVLTSSVGGRGRIPVTRRTPPALPHAEEECPAACRGASMMTADHVRLENPAPEAVERILDALEQGRTLH